jgi:predicted peptidase
MRHFHHLAVAGIVFGLMVLAPAGRLLAADAVQQKSCELNRTVKVTMEYLLYLPKDYQQKPSWPLLLFLHGAGERGDDLDLVKKHGPPKLIAAGKDFPFIVVSPQCPGDQSWETMELTALLDEIVEKYKVDPDRIYVTGLSMGGFATWALASRTPGRFAAIMPICGGGDPNRAKRLAHIPAWVFQGAKDPVVQPEGAKKIVAALKKRGGDVKFTLYPDAGHDAWTETYANPQVYEWLLEQKRTTQKPPDAKK